MPISTTDMTEQNKSGDFFLLRMKYAKAEMFPSRFIIIIRIVKPPKTISSTWRCFTLLEDFLPSGELSSVAESLFSGELVKSDATVEIFGKTVLIPRLLGGGEDEIPGAIAGVLVGVLVVAVLLLVVLVALSVLPFALMLLN